MKGTLLGLNLFQRFNDPPAVGTFAYASTSFNPAALSPDLLAELSGLVDQLTEAVFHVVVSTLITETEPGADFQGFWGFRPEGG
ncbi:MAG: hypothetical protein IT165_32600 [Bryobacterales bacterium]|nr:hypothetical protein [Bryobacterales bacterium]